jgi:hypothetical protein
MDYVKVLVKHYDGMGWCCGDTYQSLRWNKEYGEKPTDKHLCSLWKDMAVELMRNQRNKLLQESDYKALPDYPNRDVWVEYRRLLRDFPEVWIDGMSFPQQPE